jgi:hypothetical protein
LELSASSNKTKAGLKVARQQPKSGKVEKAISSSDDPKDWQSPKGSKPQADRTSIATSKVPVTRPSSTSLFGNDDPIFVEQFSDRKRRLPNRPTVVTTTTSGPTEVRVIPAAQQRAVNESSPTIEFGERQTHTALAKPTRLTDSAPPKKPVETRRPLSFGRLPQIPQVESTARTPVTMDEEATSVSASKTVQPYSYAFPDAPPLD